LNSKQPRKLEREWGKGDPGLSSARTTGSGAVGSKLEAGAGPAHCMKLGRAGRSRGGPPGEGNIWKRQRSQ